MSSAQIATKTSGPRSRRSEAGVPCETMARKPTGEVLERRRGGTAVYALRFRAYGRRRYLTLGTRAEGWTRAQAEDELQNVLADVRRGLWQPPRPTAADPSEPTFHEFASEWFEAMSNEGLRESSLLDYEWQLTKHLLPYFAEHALSEITIAEVDRYRQLKVREGAISATSINKTIQRLAQILDVAVERELIDRNPARGRRRRLKQRKPVRTTLDRAEQIEALISAARELDREARIDRRTIPRAALLSTLMFSGVRIGEALALRWSDVDLERTTAAVRRSLQRTPEGPVFTPPKSARSRRQVLLTPTAIAALRRHRIRQAEDRLAAGSAWDDQELVFANTVGRPLDGPTVTKAFQAALARAELPRIRFHDLRHTAATLLLSRGIHPKIVSEQLGHSQIAITLDLYSHVTPTMQRDAAAAIESMLGGAR